MLHGIFVCPAESLPSKSEMDNGLQEHYLIVPKRIRMNLVLLPVPFQKSDVTHKNLIIFLSLCGYL